MISHFGREGQRALEVVDRLVEAAHPVVVVEHRALDVEVLPERAAAHAGGARVQDGGQALPPVGHPLPEDELGPVVVARGGLAVEARQVLHPGGAVVADPRDVVAVDDAVPVVVLQHHAVELHVLAGGRRERDPLVLPLLARLAVDGDVGEEVGRVLVDVRRADREVLDELPLEVHRELVRVLVLHVGVRVERPRVVDRLLLLAERGHSVDHSGRRERLPRVDGPVAVGVDRAPRPDLVHLVGPAHRGHVGAEPSEELGGERRVVPAVRSSRHRLAVLRQLVAHADARGPRLEVEDVVGPGAVAQDGQAVEPVRERTGSRRPSRLRTWRSCGRSGARG